MGILGSIFGEIAKPVTDIIGKSVVDKDKKKELEYKLQELVDRTDQRYHTEIMGQLEINKEEAKHASIFVAGWRPAVGWVGAFGLGYAAIVDPFMTWVATVRGYTGTFPELDTALLMTVLGGILGLGGLRTYEGVKGIKRNSLVER